MTTKFTYKYYDVETHKHAGEFPRWYWESTPIPLYGCPGVTVNLCIYPFGNTKASRGFVSAFVTYNSKNPNLFLEADHSITITTTTATCNSTTLKVGNGGDINFGGGWGLFKHVESGFILKEPQVTLEFTVKVLKLTETKGNQITVTRPSGEQETTHTST